MGNEIKHIQLELFDGRNDPPIQTFFSLSATSKRAPTVFEALLHLQIVNTKDDLIFQKKGSIGVFSIVLGPDDTIYDGDRIELYRPILIDPKKIRRKKANQNKDTELKIKAKIRKERKDFREL
jgi:putative ubiquitin-RnfH superfamily antitoxin RatB of RatAB toxin-antitoxin module